MRRQKVPDEPLFKKKKKREKNIYVLRISILEHFTMRVHEHVYI